MKRLVRLSGTALLLANLAFAPVGFAETSEELFLQGQTAYGSGQVQQALDYFQQAVKLDANNVDAYFNIGAIYYNLKRYPEALEAFNQVLQRDPNEAAARYETGRIFEKMGRIDEAIAAFELISSTTSRYAKAQENIAHLKTLKQNIARQQKEQQEAQEKALAAEKEKAAQAQQQAAAAQAETEKAALNQPSGKPAEPEKLTLSSSKKVSVQEFAKGFFGPTGLAVDQKGNLYVANFSKNTVYKVTSNGDKELLASGSGINGPVGLTIDQKTGDLYIANHLDNTVSRITPDGKISVVATGLKKPYNIYLDEGQRTLYVSQQETNSIAKIKLN